MQSEYTEGASIKGFRVQKSCWWHEPRLVDCTISIHIVSTQAQIVMYMNKRFFPVAALVLGALLTLGSCGKKAAEAPPINELEMYEDKVLSFGMKIPKGWKASTKPGELATYYSSEQVAQRFVDYKDAEVAGAQVAIIATKTTGPVNLDSVLDASKIFTDASAYKPIEAVKIGGVDGKRLSYEVDYSDGKFKGETYVAMKDSTAFTVIKFEAFAGTFDALHPKFEEMLASAKLAFVKPVEKKDTVAGKPEPFKASETLVSYAGANNFAIQIPDNFSGNKKGGGIESVEFKGIGGPADCIIRVDVSDASKQGNLEKIVNQNKGAYKGANPTSATLDGEKAFLLEDTPAKDVRRKTYFALKNSKLYRVTVQWYQPEKEYVLPMFEKAFATFKFK
jgi:hypothetical protein